MDMKTYLTESERTASNEPMRTDLVSDFEFYYSATAAVLKIKELDAMKKALFYGKKPDESIIPQDIDDYFNSYASQNVVHAILGIVTEAGELLELLLDKNKYSNSKLKDECGDGLWYNAMLIRDLKETFESVGESNLTKLKVRYPDKFDKALAVQRNEDKENAVFA